MAKQAEKLRKRVQLLENVASVLMVWGFIDHGEELISLFDQMEAQAKSEQYGLGLATVKEMRKLYKVAENWTEKTREKVVFVELVPFNPLEN